MDPVTFEKWFSIGVTSEGPPYEEARQQVVKIGPPAVSLLQAQAGIASDWPARVTAEGWIAWITRPDLCRTVRDRMKGDMGKPLAPRPMTGTWSPSARGRAIAALGSEATPCILELLFKTAEADEKGQEALIFALSLLRDSRAVDPLIAIVSGRTRHALKGQAAYALGPIGNPAAVKPLIELLKDDSSSPELKGAAALSLGQIRDPEALQPLVDVFVNLANPLQLREQAVLALGTLRDLRASGPIVERLNHEESPEMLQQMLSALDSVGDAQALPAVAAVAEKHPEEMVRERAKETYQVILGRRRAK